MIWRLRSQSRRERGKSDDYKADLCGIYINAVTDAINNHSMNAVLGIHPPFIAAIERRLPGQTGIVGIQDHKNASTSVFYCPVNTTRFTYEYL